jgi:hypothetical protein
MRSYVTVDVDIDDVLSELSDSDLIEALEARRKLAGSGKSVAGEMAELGLIQDAYNALRRQDTEYAALILERVLYPKWATPEDSAKAFMVATGGAK